MKKTTVIMAIIIFCGLQVLHSQISVTGKITDANTGDLLPGVNIVVQGSSTGTVSDASGVFSITVPNIESSLVFSYIGYITETVKVGDQKIIDMQLVPDITSLSEVVVVGYGTMEKSNITGAISSVKAEDISKAPVPNLVEAIRGQVAGVRMLRTSGQPGSDVEFYIRGKNSLNNSNEPLIVIDGIPSTGGNLAELNTSDIESVNILKDAAAASIYGVKGANGVILVTTKEGKTGKPSLNISISQGYSDLVNKPRLMNAEEFVQLKIDAVNGGKNKGTGVIATADDVLTDAVERANYYDSAGIKEIDWHDVLLRTGKITDIGVSLSGGSEKVNFYLSGNAYLEDGIVRHSSFDRYSLRLNADYQPYKFVKLGAKIQLSKSIADETGSRAVVYQGNPDFTDFLSNTPLGSLYNENNELRPTVKGDQFDYNPLFKYRESQTDRLNSRILVNPYIEFNILDGLTYRINSSVEQRSERYGRFESSKYKWSVVNDKLGQNSNEVTFAEPVTYLLDNIISYSKDFNKHAINATAVYGFQKFTSDSLVTSGQGSPTDLLSYYSISGTSPETRDIQYLTDEWSNVYYVGRFTYSYDRRYNFTTTLRYDKSTKFGPDLREDLFPSYSFAWNMHEESFLSSLQFLTNLKYRLSYGVMGNDQIESYGYIARTDNVSYAFQGTTQTGLTSDNLPNTLLHWETSKQLNTGVDFGFLLFNRRLDGSLDVYKTNTTGLILDKQIVPVTGFAEILSNVGETENRGIEFNMNYNILDGDFKWNIGLNVAKDQNKILRLNDSKDADGNPIDDLANGWFIGQDIDVVYDFDFIGIWQIEDSAKAASMHWDKRDYGPGDPKIRDVDGNDTINFDDQTFLGTPTPDWYGGLRNTFSYKGFELTILIEAVQGVTKVNSFYGSLTSRGNEIYREYWTPGNRNNEWPEPNNQKEYNYIDAVRVRDASFVALRNVSLSYNLPGKMLNRVKVSNMQLYIRGNNLKYFTDYNDAYSPETNVGAFPITKVWTFGTNITF